MSPSRNRRFWKTAVRRTGPWETDYDEPFAGLGRLVMQRIRILAVLGAITALSAWACGGSTTSTNNNADSGSGSGSGSGGGNDATVDTGSSSGGSSSSSGGSGSSSGGVPGDAGMIVEGGTFPCGANVCTPPNVCCTSFGMGGGGSTCEAKSACTMGIAESCTADTCPEGSLCCGDLMGGGGGVSGSTQCIAGTSCGNEAQLCSNTHPCPSGERCTGLGICRMGMGMDGGFHFDSGMPMDAGGPSDAGTTTD
jgi:hypothetical protein